MSQALADRCQCTGTARLASYSRCGFVSLEPGARVAKPNLEYKPASKLFARLPRRILNKVGTVLWQVRCPLKQVREKRDLRRYSAPKVFQLIHRSLVWKLRIRLIFVWSLMRERSAMQFVANARLRSLGDIL